MVKVMKTGGRLLQLCSKNVDDVIEGVAPLGLYGFRCVEPGNVDNKAARRFVGNLFAVRT